MRFTSMAEAREAFAGPSKPKRARKARKLPAPLEKHEQERVVAWLRLRKHICWSSTNGAQVGGRNRFAAVAALKRQGMLSGAPDIVVASPASNGLPTAIEMKRANGVLSDVSPEQRTLHAQLLACGWNVVLGWGADDAISKLERAGY